LARSENDWDVIRVTGKPFECLHTLGMRKLKRLIGGNNPVWHVTEWVIAAAAAPVLIFVLLGQHTAMHGGDILAGALAVAGLAAMALRRT
jgi:hypothetical protein